MASYNRVILMGNLTRDPEMRFSQGDKSTAICKIGMAVNRRYKSASGEWVEKPTFVDVTLFGNRAEAFEKYHRKGSIAFIEGRLEFDSWEDKNSGQKRSKLYVVAENWEFAGGRGDGGGGGGGGNAGGGGNRAQPEAPAQQESPADGYGGYTSAPSGGESSGGSGSFDDTPF
jgi:single-strand DNA-binding protein